MEFNSAHYEYMKAISNAKKYAENIYQHVVQGLVRDIHGGRDLYSLTAS